MMALSKAQKKALGEKGYFHGSYGTKIGWENMKGSDNDILLKKINNDDFFHYRMGIQQNPKSPTNPYGLDTHSSDGDYDAKVGKKFLKTDDYLAYYQKRYGYKMNPSHPKGKWIKL